MKRLFLILIVFVCAAASANAQKLSGQALIDSLLAELPDAKEDTNKVSLLVSLYIKESSTNSDHAVQHLQMALDLANKLNWKKGMAWTHNHFGYYSKLKGDYIVSEQHYLKAVKLYEELDDKNTLANLYNGLGGMASKHGDYPKALKLLLKALAICKEVKSEHTTRTLTNISMIYQDQNNFPKALEYLNEAMKVDEENGIKGGSCQLNLMIGVFHSRAENLPEAIRYLTKARKIAEETFDEGLFDITTANLGQVYARHRDYAMALAYFFSSLQTFEEQGRKAYVAKAMADIGKIYAKMVSDTAHIFSTVALTLASPTADLPKVYIPKGGKALLNEAEKYTKKALEVGNEIGEVEVILRCYENLSHVYELKGDYKKALEAHKESIVYKDSLFNQENTAKIARLEVQAEYEKKQVADSIQNVEAQKLADVKLQRQPTMTYSGIGVAVLLLAFSVFIFRNNKKLGVEKEKSETLLYNILPEEVAYELKERGATTAQHYDNVTVLFTDFVNFTTAGERMGSQALVEELHNCFKAFDDIMGKYGIEKIKTIGDAYLAVCGLPTADKHHAEKIVKAAQEIKTFMLLRREQLGDKTFELRIGVHSGSVVAGIVGVKKFAYDIWGDTVNTAARMEQNSKPGNINIS